MVSDRHNIVLTGFMGTGKSTVGRRAAEVSGREFVDLDREIVRRHGDISALFDETGEEGFRNLEREVVAEIAPRRNLVIATGGGTLLDSDNVVALLGADIFTLTATPEAIESRVVADDLSTRPLLAGADDPRERITELLDERADAYGKFTQIDTTDKTVEEIVRALERAGADLSPPVENSGNTRERILWVVIAVMLALFLIVFTLLITF